MSGWEPQQMGTDSLHRAVGRPHAFSPILESAVDGHVTGLTLDAVLPPRPKPPPRPCQTPVFRVQRCAMQRASRRASSARHRAVCSASARTALATDWWPGVFGEGGCSILDRYSHRFCTAQCWLSVNL